MSAEPPELPPELSPEQMAALVKILDRQRQRNRFMIAGYTLALIAAIGGFLCAFWLYGALPEDSFRGWVFLAPVSLAGSIIWVFGYLLKKRRT